MSARKFDAEAIADAWWTSGIGLDNYVDALTVQEYRELQAAAADKIKHHEIRLNRLRNLRDELRARSLRAMGVIS